jgi:hypothetical protein
MDSQYIAALEIDLPANSGRIDAFDVVNQPSENSEVFSGKGPKLHSFSPDS